MLKAAPNRGWSCACLWLVTCGGLFAQEGPITTIDEVLGRDLALLQQADERLQSGAPSEAIDILVSLMEEQSEKLVALRAASDGEPFTTYVTLREAILRRVVGSESAAEELRKRHGEKFGSEAMTPGRLNWSVLDPRTAERWMARADELTRLGAWNDARDYLNHFALKNNSKQAERLARLVYISLLESSPKRAKRERDLLETRFPQARGTIAGREELLLKQLDTWLTEFAKQGVLPRRNSQTHLEFDIEPERQVAWRCDAEERADLPGRNRRAGAFPELVTGRLFLSTDDAIYAWEANELSGAKSRWPGPLYRTTTKPERTAAPLGITRHELSVSDGIVYARLGGDATRKRSAVPVGDLAPAVIVAQDAVRGGVLLSGFPLSPGLEEEFDGPPLVHEGRMYLAIRKRDEMRTQLFVRCVDVTSGKLIWQRSICNAEARGRGIRDESSQTTLVLDGERLYVAPQLGCVACIDASSGAIRWLTRYPRSNFPAVEAQEPDRWQRGLGAMHLRGDLLVVLAADSEKIFALSAATGERQWSCRRESMNDAVDVLGATEDQIVLMGKSIYWLDAASGQVKACYPERWVNVGQERNNPHGAYGRGIWAGDSVWYPSRDAILKVSLAADGNVRVTSELTLPSRKSAFGNLAYLNGRLYWASPDGVMAWNSPETTPPAKRPPLSTPK